jgi:sterol desaturase/sphingolipid hydroxylase (fatty acid hydroxylase superfamily)
VIARLAELHLANFAANALEWRQVQHTFGEEETVTLELSAKQRQFNAAMERYRTLGRYQVFNTIVSLANVSMQVYLLTLIWPLSLGAGWQVASFAVAFVLTDFVNGLVHMLMDNNDRYDSIFGPFIANFHLHHKVMQYKKRNLAAVYFNESGSKIWLVGYLLIVCTLGRAGVHPVVLHILVYAGILSSVAEVSHYLCHSSDSALAMFLGRIKVLLPKRHHARHHLEDNKNYAFLNGVSDPLLNCIAAVIYPGYKQTTDMHYAHYVAEVSGAR